MLCFVFGCDHNSKNSKCSKFRFPAGERERRTWKEFCKRKDAEPSYKSSRICSCHFAGGKKENGFVIGKRKNRSPSPSLKKRQKSGNIVIKDGTTEKDEKDEIIQELREKNEKLEAEVEKLQNLLKKNKFCFDLVMAKGLLRHYTGMKDVAGFYFILNFLRRFNLKYYYGSSVLCLSLEDQLLLFLMKLRHNFTLVDLETRFNVSRKVVSNVFKTLLFAIHVGFYQFGMAKKENIPSVQYLRSRAPECYSDFPNCRVIVDCTEMKIACPREDMDAQKQTYSHYKNFLSFKALTGVTPDGLLIFASDLYPGSISDREIFQRSGIIDIVKPGELILADKGFAIHDLMPTGVMLNIPPFLRNPQFTVDETNLTHKVARTRVQVERVNQRIKIFRILDCISVKLRPYASKLFQVCCVLVHFQPSLIDLSDNFDNSILDP